MALWHLAAALFLFRWIFRDPKVDVRFLAVGALLPDIVDLTIGTVLAPARFSTGELWLHTLAAPTIFTVIVLAVTRRGRRRRAWMAMAVAMLFHLLVDGMWTTGEVFFWPLFGFDFPTGTAPFWPLAWERALGDPIRWLLELVGFGYLGWIGGAAGLADPERRRRFLSSGRLEMVEPA